MTIPVMVISWSMSWGFSSLKLAVLSALYDQTRIWWSEFRVRELGEVQLVDGHVQDGDDLLGVADQLTVEALVVLLDVAHVDVEEGLQDGVDLLQPLQVEGLVGVDPLKHLVISELLVHEGGDELAELAELPELAELEAYAPK